MIIKRFNDIRDNEIFFNVEKISYFCKNFDNPEFTDVYMGDNKIITLKSNIESFIKEISVNKNLLKG